MAKLKLSDQEQVSAYIANLEPAMKAMVEILRKFILEAADDVAEQIKWNSPSFYYMGDMKPFDPKAYKRDIVVGNLHRGKILLVFPSGAKVKDSLKGKDYPDGRKIITINNLEEASTCAVPLQQVIRDWLQLIDK